MVWSIVRSCVVGVVLFVGACRLAQAGEAPAPLVSVAWLQQQLAVGSVQLVDASSERVHAKVRIAGSQNADVFMIAVAGDTTQADVAALSKRLGLRTDRSLVLYDQGADMVATSLYFDLLSHGFPADKLHVLDGGLSKWRELGGAVLQSPPASPPEPQSANMPFANAFVPTATKAKLLTDLPEFITASGDVGKQSLVEALEPEYYFGARGFFERAGHVPRALLWSGSDLFNADKTFKSKAELQRMATHLGLERAHTIHNYCGGGVAASTPWFALKVLLNYPDVKLFKGSERAYQRDPRTLPMWTHPAPHLLRDASYASTWTSPMLRGRDDGQVTLIDVRASSDFALGHPKGALSWPAQALDKDISNPAALAASLGAVGLNAQHEAIVVSSGGINREAALAYVALRNAGQRRVSLLSPSVDEWALAGNGLDRPKPSATKAQRYVAQTSSSPFAQLVPAENTPRQYLASGDTVPVVLPDGVMAAQVLHVPASSLVQANGSPKPAKDMWAVLQKAGVSRYAELVTFASQPGDAAMNLIALELMGFAKVSMLKP